jgi:hypothetical protein
MKEKKYVHAQNRKFITCENVNDMNVEIILMKTNFDERVRGYDTTYNMQ